MTEELTSRVEKLEIDLAHAQRVIDDLNTIVTEQGRTIDKMSKHLLLMTDQLAELADTAVPIPASEKPPHY
ncbi:protein SlyX [Roseibium aquae]|uniref:Protein SlyX n=1 Tax=Roseibium aquae TaxID=1323746 RepID=A0A916X2S0_9HYPH|nr:SlyX family protein [Roseibium aquae]GGB52680.1 protein SlyX [Roseibium aquae]